jgi:very-short-patch-repair endonuclease
VRALHQERSTLNLTAHEVLGRLIKLNDAPDLHFEVQGAMTLDFERLEQIREAIHSLSQYGDIMLNEAMHPWYRTRLTQLSHRTHTDIATHFSESIELLRGAEIRGAELADVLGLAHPVSVAELEVLLRLVAAARRTPMPPLSWFEPGRLTNTIQAARRHQAEARVYSERRTIIETTYEPSVFAADVKSIRDQLQRGEAAVGPLSVGIDSPIDLAMRKHSWLAETLDTLAVDLQRVQRLGAEVATLLDCPVPFTLEEVAKHSWILGVVASDPRPTADWFDPQRLEQIRELVDHAATLAENIRAGELSLAAHSAEIYTFVTEDIARAYAEDYCSYFGRLSLTYRRRQGKLRATLRESAQLSYEDAAEAVAAAHRVNVARSWFAEQSRRLSVDLGTYFTGEDSDWPAVLGAIGQVRLLAESCGATGVPRGVRDTLISRGDRIRHASDLHRQLSELVARIDQTLASLTSVADITQILIDYRLPRLTPIHLLAEQFARWLAQLQDIWEAGNSIAAYRRDATIPQVAQILRDIDEILALRAIEDQLEVDSNSLREQFGALFAGLETDWDQILSALDWTGSVLDLFPSGPPPESFIRRNCAGSQSPLPTEQDELDLTIILEHWRNEMIFLDRIFPPEVLRVAETSLAEASIPSVMEWFEFRLDRLPALVDWMRSRRAIEACESLGLEGFISAVRTAGLAPQVWVHAYDKRFYLTWLDEVESSEPLLAEFHGTQHQRVIEEFRDLDRRQLKLASGRIQAIVDGRRPKRETHDTWIKGSDPAILLRELGKRARHKPLRRLFREIPNVLLALKPCLLMSPLSVSQYLDADAIQFDLVIFDEASQIKPQDAVGSIMRGTQTIVVGDPQQLPPSDFFDLASDEGDDDDLDDESTQVYESILDECFTVVPLRMMLRWHYRSRHEDLIAFSNYHFYEGRLVTFPNADASTGLGVVFEHVRGGKYDRRGARVNGIEARRVAERTIEHARDYMQQRHKRSLGVVAFSQAQRLRIEDELEILRRADPDLESFFAETRDEAFFVKNLENVQGDERDVIFISVGYADSEGRDVPIPLNFGPLNRSGGERRLNVLVTRAREQIRVISSIYPHQIDASRSSSEGVKRLHDYLKYAVEGSDSLGAEVQDIDGEYESPFEESVGEALKRRGIQIRRQIGCSGYRIDLGVEDPEKPGRFLLGIECDGATYHSYKTARDRDRLRQQVLEGLGWRIHRIWSADWFRDPEGELRRVLDAIETSRRDRPSEPAERLMDIHLPDPAPSSPKSSAGPLSQAPSRPQSNSARPQPYNEANLPRFGGRDALFKAPDTKVIAALVACVAQEGPIHLGRALARVAHCWGYERISSNAEERLMRALQVAVRKRRIIERGSFLWDPATSADPYQGPIREVKPRTIEQVAIEELAGAVLLVLQQAFAMPIENLITETAQFLGLGRTGHVVMARIRAAIEYLHEKDHISISAGHVSRARESDRDPMAADIVDNS